MKKTTKKSRKPLTERQKQLRMAKCHRRDIAMMEKVLHRQKNELVVNYGLGVDSTAILVEFTNLGIQIDKIIFADTGDEKPETYMYLATMNAWLVAHGQPEVSVIKRYDYCKRGISRTTGKLTEYTTLYEECWSKYMLPSLAFGFNLHSCSIKWKANAIDRFLSLGTNLGTTWRNMKDMPTDVCTQVAPIHVIGYDASEADWRRRHKADVHNDQSCNEHDCYRFYPLQLWAWGREECINVIKAAGLPVPVKSACYYCPASQKWELAWLAAENPTQFLKAIALEDRWIDGKHGPAARTLRNEKTTCKGLGFTYRWRTWAEDKGILRGTTINTAVARAFAKDNYQPKLAGTTQVQQLTVGGKAVAA